MKDSKNNPGPVYSKNTIEFVAVAKSYCDFLDQLEVVDKSKFIETMVRLLPLLYLKGSLIPQTESLDDNQPEIFAAEMQYENIAAVVRDLLGSDDNYLEVMRNAPSQDIDNYLASISEDIADIWQDLYNFVETFRQGNEFAMNEALYTVKNNFASFWGRSIVNVLRALHELNYTDTEKQDEDM
jgi:hypothetical protein